MIIVGAKGHAKEIIEIIREREVWNNLFFFDNISGLENDFFLGYPLLKNFKEVEKLFKIDNRFTLGLGFPSLRSKMEKEFSIRGGMFVSLISKKALVGKSATLGEGVNVMPFCSVFNNVIIKKGVLINSYASIHHDTIIGEYTEISPGARVLGGCKVGKFCSIGSNATILPNLEISDNVVIGAGAVVTKNISSSGIFVGVPAERIKK